jgi:phosphatidylglycerophosphate synthase
MSHESPKVIKAHDRLLADFVLPYLPKKLLPNHLTILRFFLLPVIIHFAIEGMFIWLFFSFLFVAFTDALDGTLARTKNLMTDWGAIIDPLADKLLVVSLTLILVFQYLDSYLGWWLVGIETVFVVFGAIWHFSGRKVQSNNWGKAKMVFEVLGLAILITGLMLSQSFLMMLAFSLLWVAVLSGTISFVQFLRQV